MRLYLAALATLLSGSVSIVSVMAQNGLPPRYRPPPPPPLAHHANQQVTWVTEGRCGVTSQGQKFIMTAGTVMVIPPNTPHEFVCTEDTIDIDFFSPQRQDWIDGIPSIA